MSGLLFQRAQVSLLGLFSLSLAPWSGKVGAQMPGRIYSCRPFPFLLKALPSFLPEFILDSQEGGGLASVIEIL